MRTVDPWAALADPSRREILARITEYPNTATDLSKGLPISRPAVCQHLKVLLDTRLVEVHSRGRDRIYQARPDGLAVLRAELDKFWSRSLVNFKHIAESTLEEEL